MSIAATRRYIDTRSNRIMLNVLKSDADQLPTRHKDFKSFKQSFGDGTKNYFEYETKDFFVVVDIKYAFAHFLKNTYNDIRKHLNATLLPTLTNPLIIVKSKHEGVDTLTFYKPFKNESDLFHMLMFKAFKEENGKYYFKTIYEVDGLKKVEDIIRTPDANTLHFKYAEGNGS